MQFDTIIDQIKSQTVKIKRLQKQNEIMINKIDQMEQMINLFLDDDNDISHLNQGTIQTKNKMKKYELSKPIKIGKIQNYREIEDIFQYKKTNKQERREMKQMKIDNFINQIQILKEKRANAKTKKEINEVNKEIESLEFYSKEKLLKPIHRKVTRNFQISYQGEGYVYEHLLSLGCFKKVEWNVRSYDKNSPSITLNNNHKYFIKEIGEHYDIYAEDYHGKKYYFEVKATSKESRKAQISKCQNAYGHYIELKNGIYIVAIVSNVFTSPSIEYYLFIPEIDISENIIEIDDENKENFLQKISEIKSKYKLE